MKIVIKLHEKDFESIKKGYLPFGAIADAIRNGTPLPKHHGRLVDADWVKNTLDIYVLNEYGGQFIRRNDIDSVPTIIEGSESE